MIYACVGECRCMCVYEHSLNISGFTLAFMQGFGIQGPEFKIVLGLALELEDGSFQQLSLPSNLSN